MIVLFHSLWFVGRLVFTIIRDKLCGERCASDDRNVRLEPRDYRFRDYPFSKRCVFELKKYAHHKDDIRCKFDEEVGLKFFPPVYAQRYNAIKESMVNEIWKGKLNKVLDIGCAELSFFPFIKYLPGVEEIIAVDVDAQLLEGAAHRAAPLLADHLSNRTSPLHVMLLAGSIAQHDPRLLGCDAVIAIELIEHLYPYDLEEVPFTIFGYICPSVAFITTPNADFNLLFGSLRGFRHPDHKFEWSRIQFQDWAINVTERYPDYEVEFHGIGAGPVGSEYLGCCSQMAVFTRKTLKDSNQNHGGIQRSIQINTLSQPDSSHTEEVYKVIADYRYPVYVDNRSKRQKLQDSASCVITNTATKMIDKRWAAYHNYDENVGYPEEDFDDHIVIPLEDILKSMDDAQLTESQLRELLEDCRWDVKEMEGKLVVDYHSTITDDEEINEEERESIEVDKDWEQGVGEGQEWCSKPQNISPAPSWTSDWNEDDTQTRAYVDSGYPNSFSAHDKDLGNSVDLHGSSLEEDSGDDMEDDMENDVAAEDIQQEILLLQDGDMDNQAHFNAAAIPGLFYEEVANQDENQDVVNNNRDNEGNNAEAILVMEHREEDHVEVDDGSESEGSIVEQPSEEESELEDEKLGVVDGEEKLVNRRLEQMHLPRRDRVPLREHHIYPNNLQEDINFFHDEQDAAGEIRQNLLAVPTDDVVQDEGFAESVSSGSAVAVAAVDEIEKRRPRTF